MRPERLLPQRWQRLRIALQRGQNFCPCSVVGFLLQLLHLPDAGVLARVVHLAHFIAVTPRLGELSV